ncbi:hypothetical protein C8R42DRAFT_629986 [Lentinula raphanica]|nr:hypothetical protein C8R42DRAFT_629986 [Lentinula raphanica]
MEALNADVPAGQPLTKLNQASKNIADKWAAMSKEERVAATKDHVVSLRERKESKELGTWHNQDISANHDTSMSVSRIKEELTRLNSRTGDESILIICRGSITRFHAPEYFCSSPKAEKFLTTVIKISSEDMSYKMDAFMTVGVEGVARNQVQVLMDLKASTAALILKKLKEAGGRHAIKKMYYVNFEDHITRQYKIIVKNWPLKEFKSPGSLNSHADLTVLFNAWDTGAAYFHRMSHQEYADWEASGGRGVDMDAAAEGGSEGQNHSPDEPRAPSPAATPAFSTAAPSTQQDSQPAASSSNSNFVFTHMVTNQNGEAVSTTKRARKTRSDAGKPRRKKARAGGVSEPANSAEGQ